jgi:hypothetical protein
LYLHSADITALAIQLKLKKRLAFHVRPVVIAQRSLSVFLLSPQPLQSKDQKGGQNAQSFMF